MFSHPDKSRGKKLLEDCLILITSLVLTEPRTTPKQQAMMMKLIKRLQKELS